MSLRFLPTGYDRIKQLFPFFSKSRLWLHFPAFRFPPETNSAVNSKSTVTPFQILKTIFRQNPLLPESPVTAFILHIFITTSQWYNTVILKVHIQKTKQLCSLMLQLSLQWNIFLEKNGPNLGWRYEVFTVDRKIVTLSKGLRDFFLIYFLLYFFLSLVI